MGKGNCAMFHAKPTGKSLDSQDVPFTNAVSAVISPAQMEQEATPSILSMRVPHSHHVVYCTAGQNNLFHYLCTLAHGHQQNCKFVGQDAKCILHYVP